MKKFVKSIKYGRDGIIFSFLHERNIKIQSAWILIAIIINISIKTTSIERMIFTFAAFTMFAIETINSSIEKLADEVTLKHKKEIGLIKDLSAGASGLVTIGMLILWLLIIIY